MSHKTIWFLSLLFAVLSLVPAMAHLLEMPNKLQLSRDEYMTVQQIYRGWALVGVFIFGALLSLLALSLAVRKRTSSFRLVFTAFLCIVATQVIFWTFTFPMNQLTGNWTIVPQDWIHARNQWEYSHAISAVLNIAAVVVLILAIIKHGSAQDRSEKDAAGSP
ncbi:DUF1772 domain-containing protein [Oligoflexus tunisiensis]|uniref:DUF1772 domain-containing protein n=1 Tax=Oligoflexus tunisiensis TaxID=708132 RepID=UPI000AC0B301|nr:DUF1772 domain-containing protein [Oligoflexus tunisiensis]